MSEYRKCASNVAVRARGLGAKFVPSSYGIGENMRDRWEDSTNAKIVRSILSSELRDARNVMVFIRIRGGEEEMSHILLV
jgi:hypothetical protein